MTENSATSLKTERIAPEAGISPPLDPPSDRQQRICAPRWQRRLLPHRSAFVRRPDLHAALSTAAVRPIVSKVRWINAVMSVSVLAAAPKTWRPPSTISTLPKRTSKWRSPSSQLRMKVESKLIVIAAVATGGLSARLIGQLLTYL